MAVEDAFARYDDSVISAEIMDECHVVVPGPVDVEKLQAAGDAAFQRLLDSVSQRATPRRDEDVEKADFMLKKRTEADLDEGRRLVASKGCPSLIQRAREIMESYRR